MADGLGTWGLSDADIGYLRESATVALLHIGKVMRDWCAGDVSAADVKVYRDVLYCVQQYIDAVGTVVTDGGGCVVALGEAVRELAE